MMAMREKLIDIVEAYADFLDWETKEDMVDSIMEYVTDIIVGNIWIPVTEMVPESHVEPIDDIDGIHYVVISDFVLGYTDEGDFVVVQHEVGDERDWWLDYNGTYHTITHWMPLPEKPKGE